jgi:hypothetical protein
VPFAIGSGDGASRGAEIYSDTERFVGFFHKSAIFLVRLL